MNSFKNRHLVVLFLSFACSAVRAQETRLPVVEDQDRIRYPGRPAISPDGQFIAFSEDGTIYVVSEDAPTPRALTSDASSAWGPRWSADGNSLFFVSDRGEQSQLWKLPANDFGEAVQVTSRDKGISGGELSPDESRLLIVFRDGELTEKTDDDDSPAPPFVITRRHFKEDAGDGYLTAEDTRHLYVYDITEDELRQLTEGEFNQSSGAWSPDGEQIVYISDQQPVPDEGYRTDLWRVSSNGGDPVRLTNSNEQKYSPTFSPDGESIAYLTAGDGVYSVPHIAIIPAAGGEPRILTTSLDRWINGFEFSEDGRWIYLSFDNAGSTQLARVRVRDGRVERIIEGNVLISAFDVGPGTCVAVNMKGENDTTDVYLSNRGRLTRLTDLNEDFFSEVRAGEKRKVSFESSDGTTIEAFVTFPPDYDDSRPWPTVLNVHGGPVGQFGWGYGFGTQFIAANGYVVIEPNVRGSTGFGQDFIREIYQGWGIADYPDFIAAVDYAIEAGIADPDRLAITGFSYGGYIVNIAITETDRFKAAAAGAGHSLIEANFGHDIYQKWYVWEFGPPWQNRDLYDAVSPFLRVDKVTTPTIFLGGRIDWNVTILNSELMYQALKVLGVDTELVVYPDSHHGGWPSEYEQDYLTRVVAWFDKYLAVD